MHLNFTLNGQKHALDLQPELRLNRLLEDEFNIAGMRGKEDKDHGLVWINGMLVNSVHHPVFDLNNKNILTLEGLKNNQQMKRLQENFYKYEIQFCQICYPSQIMLLLYLQRNKRFFYASLKKIYSNNIHCMCIPYIKIFALLEEGE